MEAMWCVKANALPGADSGGADPGFQVKEGTLKKIARAERGAKNVRVFRVKNHDFTPKKSYFFPI
jgi:hypothetical protein